jgi:rfaE bifunctional protein kinase chain/domain
VKEEIYSRIRSAYKKAEVPIALDSRFRLLNFMGITVSTPNEPEVEEALRIRLQDDKKVVNSAGRLLLNQTEASAILITRGSQGMVLFERKKAPFHIPIHGTADIVDNTGAGDTVISVFTLSLACGASFREASQLANYAGGVVVMKKGTATLTAKELKEAIIS